MRAAGLCNFLFALGFDKLTRSKELSAELLGEPTVWKTSAAKRFVGGLK